MFYTYENEPTEIDMLLDEWREAVCNHNRRRANDLEDILICRGFDEECLVDERIMLETESEWDMDDEPHMHRERRYYH